MLREFITWLIKSKNAVFGAAILRLYFVSEMSILFFFFFRVKFVVYSCLLKLWYENLLHLYRNLEIWTGNNRAVTRMKDFLWSSDPVSWISSVSIYSNSCPLVSLEIGSRIPPCPTADTKIQGCPVPYSQPFVSIYVEPMDMEGQLYINKSVWISHWKA